MRITVLRFRFTKVRQVGRFQFSACASASASASAMEGSWLCPDQTRVGVLGGFFWYAVRAEARHLQVTRQGYDEIFPTLPEEGHKQDEAD